MTVTTDGTKLVCHPVVVINVNGIKCRALLDTGAGSSYASSALIDLLQIEPRRTEIRRIEMIIGSVTKKTQIYGLQISNMKGDFILEAEVTKIDRSELLSLANPKYKETIARYPHLKGVKMEPKITTKSQCYQCTSSSVLTSMPESRRRVLQESVSQESRWLKKRGSGGR